MDQNEAKFTLPSSSMPASEYVTEETIAVTSETSSMLAQNVMDNYLKKHKLDLKVLPNKKMIKLSDLGMMTSSATTATSVTLNFSHFKSFITEPQATTMTIIASSDNNNNNIVGSEVNKEEAPDEENCAEEYEEDDDDDEVDDDEEYDEEEDFDDEEDNEEDDYEEEEDEEEEEEEEGDDDESSSNKEALLNESKETPEIMSDTTLSSIHDDKNESGDKKTGMSIKVVFFYYKRP